ncbi:uncharacterized protein LOC131322841 [Rhododendron vialii]|uniref:uncharacterized protein LOC131322841 n=1 Tax=Rhododendron vialii TaxID=182163 RepID=UPI00265FCCCD|nr:uncharacterized protein LOC131322841 [Rhododendron vialii]
MMSLSRISSRSPRIVLAQCRNSFVISTSRHRPLPVPSNQFHSLAESRYKVVGGQVSLFHHSLPNASAFQRFGGSRASHRARPRSSASRASKFWAKRPHLIIWPRTPKYVGSVLEGSTVENSGATAKASGDAEALEQREAPISKDSFKELTMEDLVKLVTLKGKHEEIEKIQDKVLRTFADMVNVAERARASGDAEALEKRETPVFEDSSTKKLAMEDLVKLVTEKVELLKGKHEEIEKMQGTCTAMMKLVTKREELLKAKQEKIEKTQDNVLHTLVYQVIATWFALLMLVIIGARI